MIYFDHSERPLTLSDFDEIEATMALRVPSDLKELYLSGNGGQPSSDLVQIEDWVGRVHEFLPFKYGGANTVEAVYRDLVVDARVFPLSCIPFAVDEGGDYFLYILESSLTGQIYFFDSNHADDPAAALLKVNETLQEFLKGLH